MTIKKTLTSIVLTGALVLGIAGCGIQYPDEIPTKVIKKHEIHKSIKENLNEERTSLFEIGDQEYLEVYRIKPEFKGKNITLIDSVLLYPDKETVCNELYKYKGQKPRYFNAHAEVIVYGDVDSLDKKKFYDASGNLYLQKTIDGINFLSDLEKKIKIEKGSLEHIGNIDFGIVGQLRLNSEFSEQSFYDGTSLWYNNTLLLAVQKTIDSAKQKHVTHVYLELSGSAPDGIRLSGSFSGGLVFSTGEITNQSDYLIKAVAELYTKTANESLGINQGGERK
ncbi:hypothetical protein HYU07_04535 [Candidatus Woesearchaeota archaeon]|nr:hypothetical protein [Candidatus Woesearchaeota archaeon]